MFFHGNAHAVPSQLPPAQAFGVPDPEQGCRVEGVLFLSPKRLRRTPEDAAQEVLVAGAGFEPATCGL